MKRLLLIVLLSIFPALPVYAVKMSSLYKIELQVPTQLEDTREAAVKNGLVQVLTRLSGNAAIGDNPVVKKSLKRASYYLQQYSYSLASTNASEYTLQMAFDPDDVSRLLKEANVNAWGDRRPLLLVFVALNTADDGTEIISNENPGNLLPIIKSASQEFGLPMILPEMDVAELNALDVKDVLTMNMPMLKEAAKRYVTDGIMVGNVTETSQGVTSSWKLSLSEQQWSWIINAPTLNEAIDNLMNQVRQTLAQNAVIKTVNVPEIWLKLQVRDISERAELMQLMQYLQQMPLVKQVNLNQVAGDMVEVVVEVKGTIETFQKVAQAGKRLTLVNQNPEENTLIFEWVHKEA